MLEKVFIAWGGNKSLAESVREKLASVSDPQFEGIVGGGAPADMFVTQQIFEQMEKCAHAIVLMEFTSESREFRGNLMLELGYLIKKYENFSYQINIFLIDVPKENLPSDMHGIWAEEIFKEKRQIVEIAEEIVRKFLNKNNTSPIEIDKIEKLISWPETLSKLKKYKDTPFCSEKELAHYLLHGIESCYYYMNENELGDSIGDIKPVTKELRDVIRVVRLNTSLFEESAGLSGSINFETFNRYKSGFEEDINFTITDLNLHLWLHFFCLNRLSLIHMLIARNMDSVGEEEIREYLNTAEIYATRASDVLNDISKNFPNEETYIMMYKGYVYRDLFKIHSALGNTESKISFARKAKDIRLKYFNNNFTPNSYLYIRFEEEYYLSCAELLLCTEDRTEKRDIEKLLSDFLYRSDREYEKDRRHIVSKQIHDSFGAYKNRNL